MSRKAAARVRAEAARAVDAVAGDGRSLDDALARHEAGVDERDRPLLRMLAYGTVRRHYRLDAWLSGMMERPLAKRDRVVAALIRVGLFQLTETRIPDHAVVAETVQAVVVLGRPRLKALVNALLRRALRDGRPAAGGEEARYDHPQWLMDAVRRDWPAAAHAILAANNDRAPMWLRVSPASGPAAEYLAELDRAGIGGSTVTGLEQAIRLDEPLAADSLPGFADGRVSVQDGAAQLAAPWLLEGIGGRVLDACAAPGGKTAHLKELGGDRIELTAVDVDAERTAAIRRQLDRLGLSATLRTLDASNPESFRDDAPFRAILLDAPCSATGVIRRHPDIKLLKRESDIGVLARRQRALLDTLWQKLEPGGRLLYVTCSVLAAENDEVVGRFLAETPDASERLVLHNNNIQALMRRKTPGFQILPGTAEMDGFYYACLEKTAERPT